MEEASPLDKYVSGATKILDERLEFHLHNSSKSFNDYVRSKQLEVADSLAGKRIIYLDTNIWKCITDFHRGKNTLTLAMHEFCEIATSPAIIEKCVFPIGLATLFELQSMTDPQTTSSLVDITDKYSQNICIRSHLDIVQDEFANFRVNRLPLTKIPHSIFCRPTELFGIPTLKFPAPILTPEFESAYSKANYDVLMTLPISVHLEMAQAGEIGRWNNMDGISASNEGKTLHQDSIKSFADALYVELAGVLKSCVSETPKIGDFTQPNHYAVELMRHWQKYPASQHFITGRVQANLHAIIRAEKNRTFKSGDFADFATASSALAACEALFTDKRLSIIANDKRLQINQFSKCKVISGFEAFTRYLEQIL